jgi:hypothetical protein
MPEEALVSDLVEKTVEVGAVDCGCTSTISISGGPKTIFHTCKKSVLEQIVSRGSRWLKLDLRRMPVGLDVLKNGVLVEGDWATLGPDDQITLRAKNPGDNVLTVAGRLEGE